MMDRMKAEPVKHGKAYGINLILKRLRDISTNVPRQVLVFHAFKNNVSWSLFSQNIQKRIIFTF